MERRARGSFSGLCMVQGMASLSLGLRGLAVAFVLSACAPDESPLDEPGKTAALAAEPIKAETRLVYLRAPVEGAAPRLLPVVLSRAAVGEGAPWSSAFMLECTECQRALGAFGYTLEERQFAPVHEELAQLESSNRFDSQQVPLVRIALNDGSADKPVLAAFRVVDASDASDPRYVVRLAAAPSRLFSVGCASFLRGFLGSLATTPINKRLLSYWPLAAPLPVIGCAPKGQPLPPPTAAEPATPAREVAAIVAVWSARRPNPNILAPTYPYIVTEDAGGKRRGFPLDCGAEVRSALESLGVTLDALRPEPATDAELEATSYGAQPILRCRGIGGQENVEVTSANDTTKTSRFRFGSQRDVVAFSCGSSVDFWRKQTDRALEVPVQAIPHLASFDGAAEATGATRVFTVGCRADIRPWFVAAFGREPDAAEHTRLMRAFSDTCGGAEACMRRLLDTEVRQRDLPPSIERGIRAAKRAKSLDGGTPYPEEVAFFRLLAATDPNQTAPVGIAQFVERWVRETTVPTRAEMLRAFSDVLGCGMSLYQFGACPRPEALRLMVDVAYVVRGGRSDYKTVARMLQQNVQACVRDESVGRCREEVDQLVCRALQNRATPTWRAPDDCGPWFQRTFRAFFRGSDGGISDEDAALRTQYESALRGLRPNYLTLSCIANRWPRWADTQRLLSPQDIRSCVAQRLPWD